MTSHQRRSSIHGLRRLLPASESSEEDSTSDEGHTTAPDVSDDGHWSPRPHRSPRRLQRQRTIHSSTDEELTPSSTTPAIRLPPGLDITRRSSLQPRRRSHVSHRTLSEPTRSVPAILLTAATDVEELGESIPRPSKPVSIDPTESTVERSAEDGLSEPSSPSGRSNSVSSAKSFSSSMDTAGAIPGHVMTSHTAQLCLEIWILVVMGQRRMHEDFRRLLSWTSTLHTRKSGCLPFQHRLGLIL